LDEDVFFFQAIYNVFSSYDIKVNVKNMTENFKPKITLFHCINAFGNADELTLTVNQSCEIKTVKMACSSMVKDVFLLRAFEAGADAVVVLVCPEGQCRYVEGNIRARKRVAWVRNLLDEIGLDGRRLSLTNMRTGDKSAASQTMNDVVKKLAELGPNPAV
jgi:F420-non-reducing hydrogenase iron-sulfur subunit